MKNKILILGINGMVGRIVYKYLSNSEYVTVFGTIKGKAGGDLIKFDFPKDNLVLERNIKLNKFDFIINCIGILKNNKHKNYQINYRLPTLLSKLSKKYNFKIINISSDDVYDSLSGSVNEKSDPAPDNPYGKSKLKGEIISKEILNIRTSFLGFDPLEKKGLIEWLKDNHADTINGFANNVWTGCTTLQFATLCEFLVTKNNFYRMRKKTGILNFSPLGPVSKYELLRQISKALKLNIKIDKILSKSVNRTLSSVYLNKTFLNTFKTSINKAIIQLQKFEKYADK